MQRMFRCLSLTTRKKGVEDSDSSDDEAVQEKPEVVAAEKPEVADPETADETEADAEAEAGDVASEADPDRIQVVVETTTVVEDDDEDHGKDKKDKKMRQAEEKLAETARAKQERNELVIAQIALAEESARLRRKEKREKKRMELSKYLGINAWKCDQKFLLNYGQEPEDIRERVIIIRKRNVKKERQRRINEFVLRSELNAAARRTKKKT